MIVVLLVVHLLICLALVGLVLIQQGQGADAGAAFGSGASATVFGSRGAGSFLTRLTSALGAALFLTSLVLAYLGAHAGGPASVTDKMPPVEPAPVAPAQPSQPAAPSPPPAAPAE
ncbi:preprotein translocase subunit SecG [Immundisolibacter sp.]|uniref:preprotein translocase subunit SecG n=1 Tax=Immundisolibacter sp. TaxID=1934948 RepID=UPI00263A210C|nr:preprotein translocase subunit SecG [Immundisolibacter sp.]MDD3650150.1 preprotein translocase subunit SecG [Immundisolibacter sp.]